MKAIARILTGVIVTATFAWTIAAEEYSSAKDPFLPLLTDIDRNVSPTTTPVQSVAIKEDNGKTHKTKERK